MRGSRDRDYRSDKDRRYRDQRHSKYEHHHRDRRSPSYYSSDEDTYEGNRRDQFRSHRRESWTSDSRKYSNRKTRERSRSRDRDRDRARNRSRIYHESDNYDDNYSKYREEKDYGEEDGSKDRIYHSHREESPNNTIMVRGLAPHIIENNIVEKLSEHNLKAKDIRLMRRKETGTSRGFAFVEFCNLTEAIQWKNVTQGFVMFDQCEASLHFSIPKDALGNGDRGVVQKFDWTCYKCGVNNFKRRDQCFKCGTPREESTANETGDEISPTPTNCLLLRNLSPETREEKILTVLGSLTALPIKSIRIPTDPVYGLSKCICFVELHTTLEASQLCILLSSIQPGFIIDDCHLCIGYAKRNIQSAQAAAGAINAASVALAAAQWTNQSDYQESRNNPLTHVEEKKLGEEIGKNSSNFDLGTIIVNGVTYQKYPPPNSSTYQFDKTSGFYYDPQTALYYDPNSHYYYNSGTQKYLYWSEEHSTYLPADEGSENVNKTESSDARKSGKEKQDKVKIAKKIAKDMEKWAKTLNQKKDVVKSFLHQRPIKESVFNEETIDPAIISQSTESDFSYDAYSLIENKYEGNPSDEYNSVVTDDDGILDAFTILEREEAKLMNWEKFLCLLCKRQFNGQAQLTKHQQISELHKSNLEILKRTKLTEEQRTELEKKESNYRDRAKERRLKYNQPDNPEPNRQNKYEKGGLKIISGGGGAGVPISDSNIGSKMLKAMGWKEGTGLGKNQDGRASIIEVNRRSEHAGLGSSTGSVGGESYKEAVRRSMHQRYYNELSSDD